MRRVRVWRLPENEYTLDDGAWRSPVSAQRLVERHVLQLQTHKAQTIRIAGLRCLMVAPKKKEQIEAREMRQQGIAIGEIALKLGVSKGSVSVWVRDIPLTEEQ